MANERTVFLSHSTSERRFAAAVKTHLEAAIPGLEVFASSVDIRFGQQWIDVIRAALDRADAVLVLCTPESVRRRWLHFEAGAGFGTGKPVVPVCIGGLHTAQLPDPFRGFQSVDLDSAQAADELVRRLGDLVELRTVDADTASLVRELGAPAPVTPGILVDRSHAQDNWNRSDVPSLFEAGSVTIESVAAFGFKAVNDRSFFSSPDFEQYRGLILGSPWHVHMDREEVESIRTWVSRGGRMLLLGYELGDFHHGANLNHLARWYGINFNCDIVGPAGYATQPTISYQGKEMYPKPYDEAVTFTCDDADPHPFTEGLPSVELVNVQTVAVVPGGAEWLKVGRNEVYRPSPPTVEYEERLLTQKRVNGCDRVRHASSMAVAVEAPAGLCGRGAVWAIGTWQLLGAGAPANVTLVERMLERLAG